MFHLQVGTGVWDEDSRVPESGPAAPRFCGRVQLSTAVKSSRQGPREACQHVPHPLVGFHHLLGPCLPLFSVRNYGFTCTPREHVRGLLHFHVPTCSPGVATEVTSHNPQLASATHTLCSYCSLVWRAHCILLPDLRGPLKGPPSSKPSQALASFHLFFTLSLEGTSASTGH